MKRADAGRGGELVPLRPRSDEIVLGSARFEPLSAEQQAEAVELLASLLAVAGRKRARCASREQQRAA